MRAAAAIRDRAAWLFDSHKSCGEEANSAKLLASEAAWAASACLDTHGGYGFTRDFDVEPRFRETRLCMTAPGHEQMLLNFISHNVLGTPRSYVAALSLTRCNGKH
ncbi:MAG TPA: acyl-CoA dehydrogenase family protein [Dehalococcoidia bacterium]|nr:acyl-CoA dehydrogenase family protein [Dehalococcoidia bacterium]